MFGLLVAAGAPELKIATAKNANRAFCKTVEAGELLRARG